jgi:hypothetical protein
MWLIGGSKTTARRVKNGRSARRLCEECNVVAVFDEHELTDRFNAFFVELYQTTQPRMVCSECGADRDVDELLATPAPADAAPARKPALSGPAPAAAPRAELSEKPEADVDEMLAALKRKMAKK